MWNAKLDETQAWIKIAGRNINNLREAYDNTLMAESEEELKNLLMIVKEESERASLRINIKKQTNKQTKIMAFSPNTALQMEGEKVEVVTDLLFLGSQITVNGDCSLEIRRRLLLGSISDDKCRQCVEKQRHYSADKDLFSQGYGLPTDHVWLWDLDRKEGRVPKNRCLRTMALGKTPESPLDSKEIKSVNPKGD